MNKPSSGKKAWKKYKIIVSVAVTLFLWTLAYIIFPSKADLSAELARTLLTSDPSDRPDALRLLIESKSKFTSDDFTIIVFTVWGLIALFFIARGIIRWVARTAAEAVREAREQKKPE
jgi:hypothetical protein